LITACGDKPQADADTVFLNAKVYTVNQEQPWAEAVAIEGDTIVYVGDNAGAKAFVGKATEQHDVGGKLMLPGFIDTHVHPLSGGEFARALSLQTGGTIDGWVQAIDEFAKARPDDKVIFGYGFLATTFGPEGPTRQLIDAIVPDRPVLIIDEGFHGAWANSATLAALNITQDTPDPVPGYSYYKRDENGDATGYLLEGTAYLAMDGLDVINDEVIVEGTGIVVEIMNSYGVTAAFDAGNGYDAERLVGLLRRIEENGDLSLRLVGSVRASPDLTPGENVKAAEHWRETVAGNTFHYNTLKIPDDGTVEGRTAAMFEDYQGEPGNSGSTVFTEQQLDEMITGAAAQNIDVHVHALGERAIHETLNAIEAARAAVPETDSRFTICHLQVITDQDVPRFGELDVIAQSTPLWSSYDFYGKQFVSDDQFNRYWRYKSLEDTGARLTFGSDFPASGAGALGLSPVLQIEMGHTRQEPGSPDATIQPRETERLSVESLVRGFTLDAAYQLRMETEIGSIEVGKKADLVVLDQNIFEVDAYSIHKTSVVTTMLGGEVVYAAE
jgi:predicted amidohydrolase YtcJ